MKSKFKDQCDNCGKFDYLVGMDDKCLCYECRNNKNIKNNQKTIKKEQKQLTIYDFIDQLSHFSHSNSDIMYLYNFD